MMHGLESEAKELQLISTKSNGALSWCFLEHNNHSLSEECNFLHYIHWCGLYPRSVEKTAKHVTRWLDKHHWVLWMTVKLEVNRTIEM